MRIRKLVAIIMAAALTMSMFAGCMRNDTDTNDDSWSNSSSSSDGGVTDDNASSAPQTGSDNDSSLPSIADDAMALNEFINGIKKQLKPKTDDIMNDMKGYVESAWESWIIGLVEIGFEESDATAIVNAMREENFQIGADITILTSLNGAVHTVAEMLEKQSIDDLNLVSNQATMIVWNIVDYTKYFKDGLLTFVMEKDQWDIGKQQIEESLAESLARYKAIEAGLAGTSNPFDFIYEAGLASFTSLDGTEYYVVGIGVRPNKKTDE